MRFLMMYKVTLALFLLVVFQAAALLYFANEQIKKDAYQSAKINTAQLMT